MRAHFLGKLVRIADGFSLRDDKVIKAEHRENGYGKCHLRKKTKGKQDKI